MLFTLCWLKICVCPPQFEKSWQFEDSAYYSQMRLPLKVCCQRAIHTNSYFLLKSDNISPALTSLQLEDTSTTWNWQMRFISQEIQFQKQYDKGLERWFQYVGSVKNLLSPGMISGFLLRTNFLRKFSLYFSPSAWLSKIPAALFSLLHLETIQQTKPFKNTHTLNPKNKQTLISVARNFKSLSISVSDSKNSQDKKCLLGCNPFMFQPL